MSNILFMTIFYVRDFLIRLRSSSSDLYNSDINFLTLADLSCPGRIILILSY